MKLRALLIGVAAAAIAVGSGVSVQADEAVYGVLLKTLSNPFWGAMEKGIHDGADATVHSVGKTERLVEGPFLSGRSLVEPVLPRDYPNQEYERSDCSQNQRHETQAQTVGVRTLHFRRSGFVSGGALRI